MPVIFPSRTDYETLIRRLDLFADDSAVKKGKVLMRKDGLFPQAFSGGRAVVFPVMIETRKYALKCWIQSLGALEERYQAVSQLIQKSKPPYLIESVYRENELLFNGIRYPVLQMQWSDSETLKEWVSANINDSARLRGLAQRFLEVVADMHKMGMSHGDLQHENILVGTDSVITLVDYDSIYLEGLDHLDDEVKGLPGFQHPSRSLQAKANPKSDYLSEYVIYMTLMVLSKRPDLWMQAKDHHRLLFSQQDLSHPSASDLFNIVKSIDGLSDLTNAFQSQCLCTDLNDIVPIESVVALPKISASQKTQTRSSPRVQSPSSSIHECGTIKDLRKAKAWNSSQDKSSDWIFGDSTPNVGSSNKSVVTDASTPVSESRGKTSSGPESGKPVPDFHSTDSATKDHFSKYEVSAQKGHSNPPPLPCVKTPKHVVEGSLSGQEISRQSLTAISFERVFIRLICISGNGRKNELLISKERLIGWRGIGLRLELVTSNLYGGTDVLVIFPPYQTDSDCIATLINQLKNAGIDLVSHPSSTSDGPIGDSFVKQENSQRQSKKAYSSSQAQDGKPSWTFPPGRQFSYATVNDIVYCSGKSLDLVLKAVKTLQVSPPFTLIEADRIAGLLLGDPSIRRAFDKTLSSQGSSVKDSSIQDSSQEPFPVQESFESNSVSSPTCEPSKARAVDISSNDSASDSKLTGSSQGDCFVATAIYETDCHHELSMLRDYRDSVLMSSRLGRHFVSLYYKVGPGVAQVIVKTRLAPKLRPLMSFVARRLSSGK